MTAPKPCTALVRLTEGATFECSVANLCERGVFLRTSADLTFRQRLKVDLLGLSLYGQVLYVSADPPGAVVSLEADIEAQAQLIRAQDDVEVLADQKVPLDEPWAEDTAAGVTFEDPGATAEGPAFEPAAEEPPPKLETGDLVPIADTGAEGTLDPLLFAAAMQDDAIGVEAGTIPMLDPVESTKMEATEPSPFDEPPLPSASTDEAVEVPLDDLSSDLHEPELPPPLDALPDEAVVTAPSLAPVSAPGVLVPPPPAPASGSAPSAPAPSAAAPSAPAPAAAVAPAAGPTTDDITSTLPELGSDGYTVRFDSPEAYRTQFESNLRHGGLVVRAGPLAIGTQRMLALAIPGQEAYTVSARVVFHEPGKLGFMLDSLALHKNKLAGLGG